MARPLGSQNKDKPVRDALRIESVAAEQGQQCLAPVGSLRWNARQLLERGDPVAFKEIADRLDGKVAQAIVGDDEHDAIRIRGIGWLKNTTGETNEGHQHTDAAIAGGIQSVIEKGEGE